jgi:energy-coupling factor transporter ATP-binding protein EcfA2/energy-coupling factor transporter transmembrane protein EcfT
VQDNLNVTGLTVDVDGRRILFDFDHTFHAGTVTLVVGRSGTGKTMLLETLSGVREPSAGTIEVGSESLWLQSPSRKKLNRRALLLLGTAFQHPEHQLFTRTVKEEFLYTLEPYKLSTEECVTRMKSSLSPDSEDMKSWQARDPYTLSGGEKRRLLLSLLQAVQPQWLLLDEPTAGVDREGVSLLCSRLQEWKQSGKGAIVVTHDFESLLPAADRVLILHEGRIAWDGTPAEMAMHPHVLEDAGLALSERLEALRLLRESGFPIPDGWVDAREAAAAIARGLSVDTSGIVKKEETLREIEDASATKQMEDIAVVRHVPRFMKRDPLVIWLSYLCISTGILLQSHWLGWLAGVAVTIGVTGYSRVPYRVWSKPAAALFVFTLIATLISGITYESSVRIDFSVDPAVETFFRFGRLIMVMLIGLVLLSGLSHLRLKRALEQRLQGLQRLRFPVLQFALVASLMVRFLPTVVEEWHRFARISAARGKYPVRPGQLPIRRMHRTVIPFLMSLLRLGELWSILLMSRGVGRVGWSPTQAFKMILNRQDVFFLAGALGIMLMLLFISLIGV